jgi:hypothetical protein
LSRVPEPLDILREYIAAHRAGEPADPLDYLGRIDDESRRAELADLMEAFHAREGRRQFDAAAFARSPARAVADQVARSVLGPAGTWPVLLPRLRNRAQISRAALVARLAAELDVADREEKVRGYYHEMERGSLPAANVSDRVLQALGRIVGEPWAALREAGRTTAAGAGSAPGSVAFARRVTADPLYAAEAPPALAAATPDLAAPEERDEVDDLFRGPAN